MRKFYFTLFFLSLAACDGGGGSVATDRNRNNIEISNNPSCLDDVKSTAAKANSGDLVSIRSMRNYYADCVNNGYEKPLKFWSKMAAKHGTEVDEHEFLRVLLEVRFVSDPASRKGANISVWESPPSCEPILQQGPRKTDRATMLAKLRSQITFEVNCKKGDINSVKDIAIRAAKIGDLDDKKFLQEISSIKSKEDSYKFNSK